MRRAVHPQRPRRRADSSAHRGLSRLLRELRRTAGELTLQQASELLGGGFSIAELATRPDLWIGVIPFGAQADLFPVTAWTLYDERAAVPGVLSAQVVLNGARVRPYVEQWDQLAPLALVGAKAVPLLAELGARYRSMK